MRSKLDQALSVISRLQTRLRSWMDTTRNLILLASEDAESVAERDQVMAHPLGFVHGLMERIRQELGPEATMELLRLDDGKLYIKVYIGPKSQLLAFTPDDYNANTDLLASSIRTACEQRGLLAKPKEV